MSGLPPPPPPPPPPPLPPQPSSDDARDPAAPADHLFWRGFLHSTLPSLMAEATAALAAHLRARGARVGWCECRLLRARGRVGSHAP